MLLKDQAGERAVLLCNRNPFPVDALSWSTILASTKVEKILQNDKYGNLRLFLPEEFCGTYFLVSMIFQILLSMYF